MNQWTDHTGPSGPFSRVGFAALVRQRLVTGGGPDGDHFLNPEYEQFVVKNATKDAAVLIGMVDRLQGLSVLLTERSHHLSSHSGQVAFPGGRIDATDAGAVAAALREAEEEIALAPKHVEIVASLPDYFTGSGYRIAPVLGFVDTAAKLKPNPDEVDAVFEVPLAYLMEPANYQTESRIWDGLERHYYTMTYDGHFIWGVTAGILRTLHRRVFA